jgi:hypothetical protein
VQIQEVEQYVTRTSAMDALRQDTRYQESMRDGAVRADIDAVLADPDSIARLRNAEALTCLAKLRRLRDISKAHGGSGVSIDESLRPWSEQDESRLNGACLLHRVTGRVSLLTWWMC